MTDNNLNIRVTVESGSIKELRAQLKDLKTGFENAKPNTQEFSAYKSQMIEVKERIKELNVGLAQSHESYFKLGTIIREVTSIALVATAAYESLKTAMDFSIVAARIDLLKRTLAEFGKRQGADTVELIRRMKEETGGSVTEIDMLQIALKAIRLENIDLNKLPAVLRQLDFLSKLTGQSTRDLFEQFIRGAETGSKKFQVQFGLLYDVKKAEEEFAKQQKTKVEFLSEEEKRVVSVKKAFEEFARQEVQVGSDSERVIENFERLESVFETVKQTLGDLIGLPLSKFLLSVALELAIATEAAVALWKALKAAFLMQMGDFAGASKTVGEITKLGDAIREQSDAIARMWRDMETKIGASGKKIANSPAIPEHVRGLKEEEAQSQRVTKAFKEQFEAQEKLFNSLNRGKRGLEYGADMRRKAAQKAGTAGEGEPEFISTYKKTFAEALKTADAFNSAFMSGINNVAGTISSAIGGAFANVFGGAHTLLGGFVGAFTQALSDMAAQVLMSGIFNSIFPSLGLLGGFKLFASGGWIPEPVVGVGKSGARYMFGEKGPEYVVANDQLQNARQSMAPTMQPVFVIKNNITASGLATFVERGTRTNSRRRT